MVNARLPRFLATLAVALSVICKAYAGIVASGALKTCVNDGSAPEASLKCTKKLVVTLELANNKKYETERLDFEVSCVNSPNNQCPCPCDHTADPGCTCRNLAQKLSVGVTKSAVYASYPLAYIKKFNGRPFEGIIQTEDGSCKDGDYDASPTCGWASITDDNGAKQNIPGSQGFCCPCTLADISGSGTTLHRGNVNCGMDDLISSDASAHCLRYDDWWWYAGYQIGEYQMDFEIVLNLTTSSTAQPASNSTPASPSPTRPPLTTREELLTLTPSSPLVTNTDRTLSAKLLGDLESYSQVPQLMNQYIFVPAPPDRPPGSNVLFSKGEWVVVDPSMVTLDGSGCNKIGVGYAAFRNQANRCSVVPETCLAGQIYHLVTADQKRISKGLDPLYLIARYGTGDDNPRQAEYMRTGGAVQLSLNLPITSIKTSLVTLSVSADDLVFTTNRSPARIVGTQVCTFAGAICGGFQAMATKGYLTAAIQNSGSLPADYTVSVLGCTLGVMPVPAQFASIAAGETRNFTFTLKMESDAQLANASCTVSVADVIGEVADSSVVTFYANATEYEDTPDQSDINDDLDGANPPPSFESCAQLCPNLLDPLCAVKNGCWGRLGGSLTLLAAIPTLLLLLWVAFRRGWLMALVKLLGRKPKPGNVADGAAGKQEEGEARKAGAGAAAGGRSSGEERASSGSRDGVPAWLAGFLAGLGGGRQLGRGGRAEGEEESCGPDAVVAVGTGRPKEKQHSEDDGWAIGPLGAALGWTAKPASPPSSPPLMAFPAAPSFTRPHKAPPQALSGSRSGSTTARGASQQAPLFGGYSLSNPLAEFAQEGGGAEEDFSCPVPERVPLEEFGTAGASAAAPASAWQGSASVQQAQWAGSVNGRRLEHSMSLGPLAAGTAGAAGGAAAGGVAGAAAIARSASMPVPQPGRGSPAPGACRSPVPHGPLGMASPNADLAASPAPYTPLSPPGESPGPSPFNSATSLDQLLPRQPDCCSDAAGCMPSSPAARQEQQQGAAVAAAGARPGGQQQQQPLSATEARLQQWLAQNQRRRPDSGLRAAGGLQPPALAGASKASAGFRPQPVLQPVRVAADSYTRQQQQVPPVATTARQLSRQVSVTAAAGGSSSAGAGVGAGGRLPATVLQGTSTASRSSVERQHSQDLTQDEVWQRIMEANKRQQH